MTSFRTAGLLLTLALPARAAETAVIKFATLAPEGSTWMNVMHDLDKELQEKTKGAVKFKFYPGGVQGEDKDMVRKMRIGQLHSAGITGVGLGEITPDVRVLDAPFLFKNTAEVDHILSAFNKDFDKLVEAKGFVNLGWSEVGLVYVFTQKPISTPEDMKDCKMWVWEGDQIAEAMYKGFGINPIPLSVPDVLPNLQTGLINGVYSSPLAAVALQWFTKMKHIYSVPIADASGAVLVSKKVVDGLPANQRKLLLELGRAHMQKLTRLSRLENERALETLQKKQGLKITHPPSPDAVKEYEETGRAARRSLAGKLYSAELLDRVEKSLQDMRAKKDGKASKH